MPSIEVYHKEQEKLRRKNVVSKFCYGCMLANLVSALPDLYYGLWTTVIMAIMTSIFFVVMNVVNLRYSTDLAANILLFIGNLLVFIFSNLIGRASNSHLILIIGILFIPFMLNVRHKVSIIFHTTFPFLLLVILEITDFKLLPHFIDISPKIQMIFGYVNIFAMLATSPFIIFSIIKTNTDQYDLLLKASAEMQAKNRELEKTNHELDKFVYSVSHDLRSPIASMLGLVHLSKLEKDLAMLQQYEELKEKSLLKLDNFIRDILDYSQNARTEIKHEIVNWQSLITQQIETQEHSQEAKNLTITFEVTQKQVFYTDLHRVDIILSNLLSNAIKYQDVYKEKQTLHIHILVENDLTKIEFIDNGIGIGREHLDKIFKIFYRASTDSKGSGLGLYIVSEAVHKLGGQILVDSKFAEGTTFTVVLPNGNNQNNVLAR
jgi:signal transduction histidine kinase